ncbi:MAG: flagellar motor protein MotB [Hyphomicrobiales bacterium]|nr:flagellar motor protein MotB [Hyphomicrobiales bacterium]MCP5373606.1 flagellar motor protein MotB [Hyphomicrobiales bacterium]
MDDMDIAKPEEPRDNTLALFLGLYLLVLAFFILLVTISTLEEVKSKAVMQSLSSTFASIFPASTTLSAFTSQEGEFLAGQEFQEEVTGIFATTFPVAKVEVIHPGRLMHVTLPSDRMFHDGEDRVREARKEMLDRIVAAISNRPDGLRYDLDFVIGSPPAVGAGLPIGSTLEMRRAGAFAQEMAARGLPADSLAVAMAPGSPDQVSLQFHVRRRDEARVRLEAFGRAVEEAAPAGAAPDQGTPGQGGDE